MEQQNKLKDTTLRFFHDLFDLMVVNWMWVLCCIPVVTIGPATCGLYTVTLKLAREEPVNPVKDFFRGFKENFKSGLLLGLLAAILLVAAAGDIWLLLRLSGWMQGVYIAVAVLESADSHVHAHGYLRSIKDGTNEEYRTLMDEYSRKYYIESAEPKKEEENI